MLGLIKLDVVAFVTLDFKLKVLRSLDLRSAKCCCQLGSLLLMVFYA